MEVGWTVAANHGGGYAYRLARADEPNLNPDPNPDPDPDPNPNPNPNPNQARADEPLSEAAFRRTPLDFEPLP